MYQVKENEIALGCQYIPGGSLQNPSALRSPLEATTLYVSVSKNSLWMEIEGVVGFRIDRDIAATLLNKIIECEKRVIQDDINKST